MSRRALRVVIGGGCETCRPASRRHLAMVFPPCRHCIAEPPTVVAPAFPQVNGMVVVPLYRCQWLYRLSRLLPVGNEDWLERGHGGGESLRPLIKSSSDRAADRVSVRAVLRGATAAAKRPPRRRTKALVGWLLYCATAVGGTAAAFTVRDTLFPSLGAPTQAGTWLNTQTRPDETIEHNSPPPPRTDAVAGAVLVEADPSVTASSVDDQAVSSSSDQGPGSSIDNHRAPTTRSGPGTGTTVHVNPSSGPAPGTTVDGDDPEETPHTGTTPHDNDPVTTVTTTADPSVPTTTDPDHKGKGGGGGDSGGGGDGGGGGGG